jgi:hypothetical protein
MFAVSRRLLEFGGAILAACPALQKAFHNVHLALQHRIAQWRPPCSTAPDGHLVQIRSVQEGIGWVISSPQHVLLIYHCEYNSLLYLLIIK